MRLEGGREECTVAGCKVIGGRGGRGEGGGGERREDYKIEGGTGEGDDKEERWGVCPAKGMVGRRELRGYVGGGGVRGWGWGPSWGRKSVGGDEVVLK